MFSSFLYSLLSVENFITSETIGDEIEVGKVDTNSIEIIWRTEPVQEYLLHHSGPNGVIIDSDIVPFAEEFNSYTFSELLPGTEYTIDIISLIEREEVDNIERNIMQYTSESGGKFSNYAFEWIILVKYIRKS